MNGCQHVATLASACHMAIHAGDNRCMKFWHWSNRSSRFLIIAIIVWGLRVLACITNTPPLK